MTALGGDFRLAAFLEECCSRVREGEPLESCLTDYPPEYREELAELVPVATRLGGLVLDPSPGFQAALERRLLAAADQQRVANRQGLLRGFGTFLRSAPVARVAVALAMVLVLLVGGGVAAVRASADSLPDSPLYQVKTAQEWVELTLARDADARVGTLTRQIAQRGRDLDRAVRAGKPRVAALLALSLGRSVREVVDQAVELDAQGKPQAASRTLLALVEMDRQVQKLEAQAPAETRPVLRQLQRFLQNQEKRLPGGSRSMTPPGGAASAVLS